jgi:hypothetical protein
MYNKITYCSVFFQICNTYPEFQIEQNNYDSLKEHFFSSTSKDFAPNSYISSTCVAIFRVKRKEVANG